MSETFNENTRVKIPALVHLTRLGYGYRSKNDIRDTLDKQTNINYASLAKALNRINQAVLTEPLTRDEVKAIAGEWSDLLQADDLGRRFYQVLQKGWKSHEPNLQLIDYQHPENNIYEIVTELKCQQEEDYFRPDITVYINGLPLAFIEVKIPDNKEGIQAERNRMDERCTNENYRRFLNLTQLMIFSNNSEYDDEEQVKLSGAFYATAGKKRLWFNHFREERKDIYTTIAPLDADKEQAILLDTKKTAIRTTPEYPTNRDPMTPTNRILTSLLTPERLLLLLQYGINYVEEVNDNGVVELSKHIARYQQLFAMLAIRDKLANGTRSGVVWHTQGSGKTELAYACVHFLTDFYASRQISAKFYFIVDRLDLMTQAAGEFSSRGLKTIKIASRKEFSDNIKAINDASNEGGLVINVVNIQKFDDEATAVEPDYNIAIQRVYFIDEVHRDYRKDGSFLARLIGSDREAVKIGLTGTPLLGDRKAQDPATAKQSKKNKTTDIFGDYYHKYYYNQSIADGYTLRLMREGVKTSYRLKLDSVLRKLKVEVQQGLLKKQDITAQPNYVKPLVEYIEEDFLGSRLILDDKTIGGMIVADSSAQAMAIQQELEANGTFKSALVLYSTPDNEAKREAFKRGELDLLVVYQMLLTGFDAHRLKKLYLGRGIKEHGLLQALTRVNRPYHKLRYGYVVDFGDISKEFDRTNQRYMAELKKDLGEDVISLYDHIMMTPEEIQQDLQDIRDCLFSFDTENKEQFRQQLTALEDKKALYDLRQALTHYRELYNLAHLYDYQVLTGRLDDQKAKELYHIVDDRIRRLNEKEMLQKPEDSEALLEALSHDLEISFKRGTKGELTLQDQFNEEHRRTAREFQHNYDHKDPKYVALLEELQRVCKKCNFEEMTAEEAEQQRQSFSNIRKRIHALNEENQRLAAKYGGDQKFKRVHKRLPEQQPPTSPSLIADLLTSTKAQIDDKVSHNAGCLDNAANFEHSNSRCDMQDLTGKTPLTADVIKNIGHVIAQEYINHREDT